MKYDKPLCSISLGWGVGGGGGGGMASKTLIYSIRSIVALLFRVHTCSQLSKLTDSYIIVILGNSEKVIFTFT